MSVAAQVEQDVRNLLSGISSSTAVVTSQDPTVRELVNRELLAALSSKNIEKQSRARVLFIDHGYLDEIVRKLSTASAELQVEAARTLALVGSRRATPSLVAALFDRSDEVQRAAAEALLQIGDPSVSNDFVESKFLEGGAGEISNPELATETTSPTAEAAFVNAAETPIASTAAGSQATPLLGYEDTAREITKLAVHAKSEAAEAISALTDFLTDSEPQVLDGAVTVLYEFEPPFGTGLINRLIDEGASPLRERLGDALISSGLAGRALEDLGEGSRKEARDALHLLQLLIRTGQFKPLVTAIEEHRNVDVRRAVIKLLNLAGQAKIANEAAQRRLALVTQ
jgi:HEAT repeat protein